MSYCRHEYFRGILCNLLGEDVERGELPKDEKAPSANSSTGVCYGNASRILRLRTRPLPAPKKVEAASCRSTPPILPSLHPSIPPSLQPFTPPNLFLQPLHQ